MLFAKVKVPFIYYSELGDMQIDDNRNIKAGRLINLLIRYPYITISYNYPSPIYIHSPAISAENKSLYSQRFIEKKAELID